MFVYCHLEDSFHDGGVVVEDETLDEGHFLPGVFQDRGRVGRGAAEAVGGEDCRQIGGVHFRHRGRFRSREQLQEVDEIGQHQTIQLRQSLHHLQQLLKRRVPIGRGVLAEGLQASGESDGVLIELVGHQWLVELSQPELEEGSRRVAVVADNHLPLVVPALDTVDFVQISRNSKNALGGYPLSRMT